MFPCPFESSISTGTEQTTATTHELQGNHPSQSNEPYPSVSSRKCRHIFGTSQCIAVPLGCCIDYAKKLVTSPDTLALSDSQSIR